MLYLGSLNFMPKKITGLSISLTVILLTLIAYSNCTPIHGIGDDFVELSLTTCEKTYEEFYNQTIKQFAYAGRGFACGQCHSSGGDQGPQYLDNFSRFALMSDKDTVKEMVIESTGLLIRNATEGYSTDAWDHEGNGFFAGEEPSEQGVKDALAAANKAFDDCEALPDPDIDPNTDPNEETESESESESTL